LFQRNIIVCLSRECIKILKYLLECTVIIKKWIYCMINDFSKKKLKWLWNFIIFLKHFDYYIFFCAGICVLYLVNLYFTIYFLLYSDTKTKRKWEIKVNMYEGCLWWIFYISDMLSFLYYRNSYQSFSMDVDNLTFLIVSSV
jgi:hypothetical protein